MLYLHPLLVVGMLKHEPPEWYAATTAVITQGPHWLLSAPDASPGGVVVLEHTAPRAGILPRHRWVVAKHGDSLLRAYGTDLCLSIDTYGDWAPVSGDAVVLVHCPTSPERPTLWAWERAADGHAFSLSADGESEEAKFWLAPPEGEGIVTVKDTWGGDVLWGVERLDWIDQK
ncbi:uncharacterized protein CcaverHIS019_0606240 [Cutaneotrichosporon cavernicola]|uniref:Uncharacterized protein n=1 Tax=Cutaneotrichosporon cavernicola TaxID=279322 RepID=A0AA48L930_9TREE|nr:uncharacterized protein CcaverHIS019_0606240 [Cutaneotrichosporon cavernicola]BEI94165.1 hypothetical protein CcaverHIS019_0606240 [Cutaneotrichosporon cavernicola]BEJ01945.1 hypothetical protein CcaverHIS631_0606270 [Cutaneotrichosporon cavernicola]